LKKPAPERNLPRVSLNPVTSVTRREAKVIYERLMAPLPQGSDAVLSFPNGADEDICLQYDNRNILHGAWRFRAYEIIPLMEMYGENFKYRTIFDAAEKLLLHGHNDLVPRLTVEQISSFMNLNKAMDDAGYDNEVTAGETSRLPLHALLHPEDGLILEATVRQGAFDDEKAFEMLSEIKAGRLSTAIGDGFL
jgi:hypothetical protein